MKCKPKVGDFLKITYCDLFTEGSLEACSNCSKYLYKVISVGESEVSIKTINANNRCGFSLNQNNPKITYVTFPKTKLSELLYL